MCGRHVFGVTTSLPQVGHHDGECTFHTMYSKTVLETTCKQRTNIGFAIAVRVKHTMTVSSTASITVMQKEVN